MVTRDFDDGPDISRALPLLVLSQVHNPADATTYFLSQWAAAPLTVSYLIGPFGRPGFIRRASLIIAVTGTLGSAETGSLNLRISNATDYLISNAVVWTGAFQSYGIDFASDASPEVMPGDYWEFKLACPTWVTNPTQVIYSGGLLLDLK